MKQKHILETYDQILKEIKNPKIVFENDFVAFLENCSEESFLTYKINFRHAYGQSYDIKRTDTQFTPKVAEMDCIECDAVLEFIKYIPEILHLLKSQNQNEMYIMNGLSSFLEI